MPCQAGELTLFYVVRGQALSLQGEKEGGLADSNTHTDLGPTTKDLELSSVFLVLTVTETWFPTIFFLDCKGESHMLPCSVSSIIKQASKLIFYLKESISVFSAALSI